MSDQQVAESPPAREARAEREDDSPLESLLRGDAATDDKAAAKAEGKTDSKPDEGEEMRRKRRPTAVILGAIVLILLAGGALYYWLSTRNIQSTDDAYTDGRAIIISPQVSGTVVSLDVTDNEFVKQGQPLIHIDPRQYKIEQEQAEGALATAKAQHLGQQYGLEIARKNFPAQLDQAKAQLESAKASRAKAQADYDRQKSLPKLATSQQDIDAAEAALKQADAQLALAEAQVVQNSPVPQRISETDAALSQLQGQVEQAQARLDQAKLNLSWTVVTAPQDGWITKRNVEKGNYVTPGQQIFSIVAPDVWVTANFKENQLADIRPWQKVSITVDAYPALKLEGHVDSIQLGSGSKFTAFPPENATGNFVKIVQRVPVKIVIDKGLDPKIPLPLGISVEPTVTVR
jgi:membrane fusion protein, multidrug efflux system